MLQHMTNKEEADWLKQWWKNYGQGIALAVIIGLVLGYGYRHWSAQRNQKALNASVVYQQAQLGISPTVMQAAEEQLKKEYPKSIYTQLNSLDQVNKLITKGKYQQAISALQPIVLHSKIPALSQLASLKIAQLQNQLEQPQKALTVLNKVIDTNFQPLVAQERANSYRLLKQPEKAMASLNKAIAGYDKLNIDSSLLRLNAGLK
jgi:predicted negative regulator of RcsB-dependent stress response